MFSDDHYIGGPVDVWALGVLLYFMVIGNMPFRAPTVPALRSAVLRGDFSLPATLSLPCLRLIRKNTCCQISAVSNDVLKTLYNNVICLFFVFFFLLFLTLERILVHVPSRRPTIGEILSSQWINNQHITLESALVATTKPSKANHKKKIHWFSRKRILQKTSDSSQIDVNLVQLFFNTKRANSVLEENFLHPINVLPAITIDESNSVAENHTKPRRRSIFGTTLKKKIGPMEEKNKSNVFNTRTNGIEDKMMITSTEPIQALRKTVESSSKQNSIPTTDDTYEDDEEQGEFIMAPTNTDDQTNLHPLEIEARQILDKLGIDSDMLCRAIESGPRSDAIGAYRIVIHRLQRRKFIAKQNELLASNEPEPMNRPKTHNRLCAIL